MLKLLIIVCSFAVGAVDSAAATTGELIKNNWHHWRGPHANGIAPHADPPVAWSESDHIRWKIPIDGESSATPIVWGDRVFLISAIPTDRVAPKPPAADPSVWTKPPRKYYRFVVMCVDRSTGQLRWQRLATEAPPHEGRHTTNSYASGSPTTDGERLYVSFGSRGIFVFDMDGNPIWDRDLGDMWTRRGWGEAVTPVIHNNALVVNWDQEQGSFITALNAATGETIWRTERDEVSSWNTPLIVEHRGRTQVVTNGTKRVRSYDLATGELVWECGGQTINAIPSPLAVDDLVIATSGYRGAAAVAIPLDAQGDITDTTDIAWSHSRGTPYVPSPIAYGGQLYFTRGNSGALTCLAAASGELIFGPERLPGINNVYASPAAAGRIYLVGREGTTVVLQHGRELRVLATNPLDEPIDASPVLVGSQLFLRSAEHLYCIEEDE